MSIEIIYYHGKEERFACSIMTEGFRLGNEGWGNGWGNGLYLSGTLSFASDWGAIIIVCELTKGTRILWHSNYEPNTILYLKKEFGAGIVKPDFWKQIPRNKQLKRKEIISLWNYLINH
ncbi:MAG: hypothetical protein U9N54_09065 [candidate division Zixibacteria bacterium]|nr:hypothetical protein [candidate division Zixibacteria bacterium]